MTEVTGFPDYSRLSTQAGQILATVSGPLSGNPTSGAIDTTGFGFINVSINTIGGTGNIWIQIAWYLDRGLTQQIVTQAFSPPQTGQTAKQYPVLTRWCQVSIVNINALGTDSPTLTVFGSNASSPNTYTSQTGIAFMSGGASIAAANNAKIQSTGIYEGPATWYVGEFSATTWHASLQYFNIHTDGYLDFAQIVGATVGKFATIPVSLPPAPIQMTIYNDGSATENFEYAIVT